MAGRIALALFASVIAVGFAIQLHAHNVLSDARAELNHEARFQTDPVQHQKAIDDALRVDDLRPGTGGLFTAVGLATRGKRLAEAERYALRATKREPDNYSTWVALAVIRQNRGNDAGARQALARADKLNPLYRRSPQQ